LKKAVTIIAVILTVTLSVSLLETANAQTYTPGVAVGNVFKYRYELSTNVTSSNQTSLPSSFDSLIEQAETIDYIQISINGISGSIVFAETITRYKTGTNQEYDGTSDVSTGKGTLTEFFIASNLAANSPLYVGSEETLNGTITKTYTSGATRELNYKNITQETIIPPEQLTQYHITVPLTQVNTKESYWDQQTGALAQLTYSMVSTSTQFNATLTLNLNLVESNVFAVPEFPTVLVVLLVMVVPTLLVLNKRKKL
jgi:hypothetical protein